MSHLSFFWYTPIPTFPVRYSTFVRIGSGLSFADYVWVRDKPWKPWDPKHPPEFLQTSNRGQDDKGDVYLNPEEYAIFIQMTVVNSFNCIPAPSSWKSRQQRLRLLVMIHFSAFPIQRWHYCADQYHMRFTMRFPRALSIRDDLSIADCMSASGSFLYIALFRFWQSVQLSLKVFDR